MAIEEVSFDLTTDEKGIASKEISKINGMLEGAIVEFRLEAMRFAILDISITIPDKNLTIFDKKEIRRNHYFAIRTSPYDEKGEIYQQDLDQKFALNDALRIDIQSMPNTKFRITVRWS